MINATSEVAKPAFSLMKDAVKFVIERYGNKHVKYNVIVRGEDDSSSGKIHFNSHFSDLEALVNSVKELKGGTEGIPALQKDLQKAIAAFQSNCLSENSKKVTNIAYILSVNIQQENGLITYRYIASILPTTYRLLPKFHLEPVLKAKPWKTINAQKNGKKRKKEDNIT